MAESKKISEINKEQILKDINKSIENLTNDILEFPDKQLNLIGDTISTLENMSIFLKTVPKKLSDPVKDSQNKYKEIIAFMSGVIITGILYHIFFI